MAFLVAISSCGGVGQGWRRMNNWAAVSALPLPRFPSPVLLPQHQKLSQPNLFLKKQQLPINYTTKIGRCSSSISQGSAASSPDEEIGQDGSVPRQNIKNQQQNPAGFWMKWKENSGEMSRKLAKLGLSAVLAYGLFDAFTYTTFFVLAFLGYEKSTGNNPAANLKALLGIVILMWTGNNVTRPFRVAGAAGLAPFIDKGLRRIQRQFNFQNLAFAFALVVAIVATCCFTVVGLLFLSRWRK